MSTIKERATTMLNLNQYYRINQPDKVSKNEILELPDEDFYILRMLISKPFDGFKIPDELLWVEPLVIRAYLHQTNVVGIKHPFCYLTIRKGKVKSVTDDEWHVDGFSLTYSHLPEQNYIWCDSNPTEYVSSYPIDIPKDFDPNKHNLHKFIQKELKELNTIPIKQMDAETLYCLDPYIIHRRPPITKETDRTFIRISFTPIEIGDVNNTINRLIPTNYTRDGVKEMRDKLEEYKSTNKPTNKPMKVFFSTLPGNNLVD